MRHRILYLVALSILLVETCWSCKPLAVLQKWAQINGITSCCSVGGDLYGGYRLIANQDIPVDQVFLEVPAKLCFSPFVEATHPLVDLEWPVQIALRLLHAKHKQHTSYQPYLDLLPTQKSFLRLPHHWTDETVEMASDSELYEETVRVKNWREFSWNDVSGLLQVRGLSGEYQYLDRSEFEWALDCIATRNTKLDTEQGPVNFMVPFLDFMNHSPEVSTRFELVKRSVDEEPVIQVRYCSGQGVKCGEEVFLNYGRLDANKALRDYGFVPSRSSDDKGLVALPRSLYIKQLAAELQGGGDKKSSSYSSALDLLRKLGIDYAGIFEIFADGVSLDLIVALRVLTASSEELDGVWESIAKGNNVGVISKNSEIRVFAELGRILAVELELLKDLSFSSDAASVDQIVALDMLVQLTTSRKDLLRQCLTWATSYVSSYSSS